ncbi:MAG: 3-methyl-2-oxobutanoate dehydrogenase subunit beta, partial [Lachnospiraceae bacterium]|nr:3-methyl-2-oxobutanoate dehydrogenase subunit beta [Lachnospiraceae bacterium]
VWVKPGVWDTKMWENINKDAEKLYESWQDQAEWDSFLTEDAEIIVTGYGISGRIAKAAVEIARGQGVKAGLIRPKTVYPFPYEAYNQLDYNKVKAILDVEMSIPALFIEDVKAAVKGRCPISTYLRSGGNLVSREVMVSEIKKLARQIGE